MSIESIRTLLDRVRQNGVLKLYGVDHIQNRSGDCYACYDLVLEPESLLSEYFGRVCEGKLKQRLDSAEGIVDYVGEFSASYIEHFSIEQDSGSLVGTNSDNKDDSVQIPIQGQMAKLRSAIRDSADSHESPEHMAQIKAFLLVATYPNDFGDTENAYFVTVRSPFTAMRHRFFYSDGAYREDRSTCLSLIEHFDFILFKEQCYAFTDKIEPFFSLQRTFKKKCAESVDYIIKCNIVSDADRFQAYANHGYSPRKFLGFRKDMLERMTKSRAYRRQVCTLFGIALTSTGEIDTTDDNSSAHFIKLICGRGKQDPFDDSACEVPFSLPWS